MGRRAIGRWWVRVGEARRRRTWRRRHRGRPVDVLVSHAEVNELHGTGVLLRRLFSGTPDLASIRSRDDYDARQRFGAWSARLPQPNDDPGAARRRVRALLGESPPRRVIVVPFHADDVRTALALLELGAGPLCTWVMDDRNVTVPAIPDELLGRLLARSALRLAVSKELCRTYERKFRLPFAFVPPVVEAALVLRSPAPPPWEALLARRGVMIGNVWGRRWLARLRDAVAGSGLGIDWWSSATLRWQDLGPAELAAAGIRWRPGPPDAELVGHLRRAAFTVLPTGPLDADDDGAAIARLSLPSKLVYTTATAHLPALVVGHPETAAARFVAEAGLGITAPYERGAIVEAAAALSRPEAQAVMRARAAALAPVFSAEGVEAWIWRSLALGRPADDRFERAGATQRPEAAGGATSGAGVLRGASPASSR